MLAYLSIFQTEFTFSGDIWAEAYAEYLVDALTIGWGGFFRLGWAGYFNLIPKVLANLYVTLDFPIGSIDYFYRASVVAFAVFSSSFIAHPFNRGVIKSDLLRILLALSVLMSLYHVGVFSFINVWYVGFAVITFVSLNRKPLTPKGKWIYLLTALSTCLTKPSIVLLPLVVLRAIRVKEYLVGACLTSAIALQTFLMLGSGYGGVEHVALTLPEKAATLAAGLGLLTLKIFDIPPSLVLMALASAFVAVIFFLLCRKEGWQAMLAMGASLLLSIYTYFFAPDTPIPAIFSQFNEVFKDDFKLHREIMISLTILTFIFTAVDRFIPKGKAKIAATLVLGIALIVQYRPINLEAFAFSANIESFREDLNQDRSVCMPITPTPGWEVYTGIQTGVWVYQNRGGCMLEGYDKEIDWQGYTEIENTHIEVSGERDKQLKSLRVPIHNPRPSRGWVLQLVNVDTGAVFPAVIKPKEHEQYSFVDFNLTREGASPAYRYILKVPSGAGLKIGRFSDGGLAIFAHFMGYPNAQEVKR